MIWGHCEACDRWFADDDETPFACSWCGRRPIHIEYRAPVTPQHGTPPSNGRGGERAGRHR